MNNIKNLSDQIKVKLDEFHENQNIIKEHMEYDHPDKNLVEYEGSLSDE